MIGYRLCQGPRAAHPYYIECISTNVYTIEELCWFLYHNPFLIDDRLVSTALTRWIAEELNMPETALEMEKAMRSKAEYAEILTPLFQSIRYLSVDEMRKFRATMVSLTSGPVWVRMKKRADALAQNSKFTEALNVYQTAAQKVEDSETDEKRKNQFLASVWYNMGVVYMNCFEYEEGCAEFMKVFAIRPDNRTRLSLLFALRLTLPDQKYQKQAAKISGGDQNLLKQVDEAVEAAREKANVNLSEDSILISDAENEACSSEPILKAIDVHPAKVLAHVTEEYHKACD